MLVISDQVRKEAAFAADILDWKVTRMKHLIMDLKLGVAPLTFTFSAFLSKGY